MSDGEPADASEAPPALPSLHALDLGTLQRRDPKLLKDNDPGSDLLEDGVYCLDALTYEAANLKLPVPGDGCASRLILVRGALGFEGLATMVDELAEFMDAEANVPPTIKMGQVVGRKECTFGANYKKYGKSIPLADAPALAKLVLDYTKEVAAANPNQSGGPGGSVSFTGVHCNWYANSKAGVPAHQDDEKDLIQGAPIFSYTFLRNASGWTGPDPMPREFRIYNAKPLDNGKRARGDKIGSVWLGQGDLLIMAGAMQTYFFHEVPKTTHKMYSNTQRINLTVRAFTPEAAAAVEQL